MLLSNLGHTVLINENRNSISSGSFFQISARLTRFTGNSTYLDWAEKIWDWCSGVGLIDQNFNVFDGTDETINCSQIDHHQWTYNLGVFLYGAAVLQNYTNASSTWVTRTAGLLDALTSFVSPFQNSTDVILEKQCELDSACNVDQLSMKAYLVRWLAGTSQLFPSSSGYIGSFLKASALGAAASCSGEPSGSTCGTKWFINSWDGTSGLGQQLCAMEAFYALLVNETSPPTTLSSVHISNSSTTANVTVHLPQPSRTGKPLFDSSAKPKYVGKIHYGIVQLLCLTFLVFF